MLKKIVSLALIYTILIFFNFSTTVFAQAQTDAAKTTQTETVKTEPNPDVKTVFSREIQKSRSDADISEIDFKKLEKAEMNRAAKAKMTKKEKTTLILVIAGFVALGIVLALTIKLKKCSEVSCDPRYDENCLCEN